MKKRVYRSVSVKKMNLESLLESVGDAPLIVGVDIAKEDMFATFEARGEPTVTVRWKHPGETGTFVEVLLVLKARGSIEVVMEPSGTYGDALRAHLERVGVPVFRVNPKRCHDAAEVYDGVPSLHDAKSATILCKLHRDGASEPWPMRSDHERKLAAMLRILEVHAKEMHRNCNRLEGLLARHWPELTQHLELRTATLLELLLAYGGPGAVASDEAGARDLMRRVGGRYLALKKIEAVISSAKSSVGVPQLDEERELVMRVAAEARRAQKLSKKVKVRVERLSESEGATQEMAPVVGKTTAAVMVAALGDPRNYESATAFLKSTGLNLKEKSSGKKKGGLHITKRGPGIVRLYLYLAVLRLLQKNPVVRAWYAKKVKRQGGRAKSKAVVAIMRKLVLSLWYVAHGEVFDAMKLFDTARLKLTTAS
jgi:transposase